jgi:DNA transformation protein
VPRPIEELRNLGPVMARRLREVGIATEDDLRRSGALGAFAKLRSRSQRGLSLNALYAMEAALLGLDWRDLAAERKAELRIAAALDDPEP